MKTRLVAATATLAIAVGLLAGCHAPGAVGASRSDAAENVDAIVISLDVTVGSRDGTPTGWAPTDDANCGNHVYATTREPTEVLLVLDRSGSMNYSIAEDCWCDPTAADGKAVVCSDTDHCSVRWPSLIAAVDATIASTAGVIQWGLKLFSTPGSTGSYAACTVAAGVEVAISANSATAIAAAIAEVQPGNNTPTAAAVTNATAYLGGIQAPFHKAILLATDGEPNCPANGTSQNPDVQGTLAAIRNARDAGFGVYIVGIGPSVGNLDSFAEAGGTNTYYRATSPQDLVDALGSISKAVTTCTFDLDEAPPDPGNVAIYLDKNRVERDAVNGWSFAGTSQVIVLHGRSCDGIRSGQAKVVQVLFGCGESPPAVIL